MTVLFAASALFVVIHLALSGSGLRQQVVTTIGEGPYRLLFSVASGVCLFFMVAGYLEARHHNVLLWLEPEGARWLSLASNFFALILVTLGLTTPNPTLVMMDGLLERPEAAIGILRVTRHPMLVGQWLWSMTHVVVNGDLASLVFFGAFVITTTAGPFSIDRKISRRHPRAWPAFQRSTSIVPFAAILAGKNRLVL
ncbi:MAG: NnrU family protein, partial [Myxococcales bacterium]|nr:NnrU family protein [Myxococcales bacterium]